MTSLLPTLLKPFALAVAVAAVFMLAGEVDAHADKCTDQQEEAASGKNYKTVTGADGRKVFVIEQAFVVCGKVPRPNVIYVLQATNINYEWENLKQDFLPEIRKSVKKAPF